MTDSCAYLDSLIITNEAEANTGTKWYQKVCAWFSEQIDKWSKRLIELRDKIKTKVSEGVAKLREIFGKFKRAKTDEELQSYYEDGKLVVVEIKKYTLEGISKEEYDKYGSTKKYMDAHPNEKIFGINSKSDKDNKDVALFKGVHSGTNYRTGIETKDKIVHLSKGYKVPLHVTRESFTEWCDSVAIEE